MAPPVGVKGPEECLVLLVISRVEIERGNIGSLSRDPQIVQRDRRNGLPEEGKEGLRK
jgi:hypothetical protein